MPRGIIFDFDGVIVDSEPLHERACRAAFNEQGMDFSHEQFVAHCIGHGDHNAFINLFRLHGRIPEPEALAATKARKTDIFLHLVRTEPPIDQPGALDLIHASAAAHPTAVCSGSRRVEVDPVLEALGVLGVLRTTVTADDVPRTKPDPAPYLLAAQRLGCAPQDCVAIEDTPTGAASALAAGLRVLAVCTTLPRERHAGVHRIVENLAGLSIGDLLAV